MGLLRRLFGRPVDETPSEPVVIEGHVHAPDAGPDEVVLPKRKRSGNHLLAGKPPAGWKEDAVKASGGIWPWGGGESPTGHHFGSDGGGGGSSGGDGGL